MGWYVVTEFVGIVGQPTVVRLVPRLRPARTSVLALLFLVRGRRLGRSPRRFIRPLKLQHQINHSSLLRCCKSVRSIDAWIQRLQPVARGWRVSLDSHPDCRAEKRGWVITGFVHAGSLR